MATPEQKEITVACKCGWSGPQDDLVDHHEPEFKHCPDCGKLFSAFPRARNANGQVTQGSKE